MVTKFRWLFFLGLPFLEGSALSSVLGTKTAILLEVTGAIGSATEHYFARGIEAANKKIPRLLFLN